MNPFQLHLPSTAATERAGATLFRHCEGRGIIELYGDLGAGKTTLVRGLLRAAGYQGSVKSPTYTLVEPYDIFKNRIYHFDLYRLGDPEELEFIGFRDYLEQQALLLIEWPQRGEGVLPPPDLALQIDYQDEGRTVTLTARSPWGEEMIQRWSAEIVGVSP
ncbi:MAG: tRNA (adenosine(37)-N6)-threonylcarbamoyltransferase complex ATPase subunit type 1 TsaE [Gammaproteobacteria bacterium]|nr:tRNA (adenosine(37)-N6)-threonylcarbamoyltransferase complex ATPase subunit type 1 TsaE [Gammaproteobacteria bacterium]